MPDPAYRAAPPGALRTEPLVELTAIFDRRSMQTHLAISPLPEILNAMGTDICTATTLSARLSATFDFDDDADIRPILAERLSELAAMGLVERA